MEPIIEQSQVAGAPSAPPATQGTPAPENPGVTSPAADVPPKVESSPAAQHARETLENAKKGIFPKDKDAKAPEKTPPSDKKTDDAGKAAAVAPPGTPPAYVPNHKYKVGGVEKEFDETIKALIKDETTEKKIRQLYADASGLGPLKSQLDQTTAKYTDVNKKYGEIDRDLRLLSHHVKNEDFDSFFADLQIPEEKILGWVERKLEQLKLPPHMQAQMERQRNDSRRAFMLQEENQGHQQAAQHHQVQARTYDLDMELLKPEVNQIAQDFDARVGRPGAFRDECMNRGALAWQYGKKDISAAEAVGQAVAMLGKVMAPSQAAPPVPNAQAAQPPAQGSGGAPVLPPPTIPNLSGSSASPIRQAPRSIADLRNLQKQYATPR